MKKVKFWKSRHSSDDHDDNEDKDDDDSDKNEDDDEDDIPYMPGMIAVAPAPQHEVEDNDITEEVTNIVNELGVLHPDFLVDRNEVYAMVETLSANPNRRKIVIDRMIAERLKQPEQRPLHIPEEYQPDKFNDLINDVEVVSRFVPNKSREEILAYLEAHHGNANRVRLVIGELLDMHGMAPSPVTNEAPKAGNNGPEAIASTSSEENNNVSATMEKVNAILELFPDADPEYLRTFMERWKNDLNYINATVYGWLESRSYPRLAEAQKAAVKRKFVESKFSVEEFLEIFPDPENYFKNNDRVVSASYRLHIQCYVSNQFRYAYKNDLTQVMEKHRFHLTPIMKEMNALWNVLPTDEPLIKRRRETLRKKKVMSPLKVMPQQIDELFYKEKLFIEMEDRIIQYKKDKEAERLSKIEVAKANDELMECSCCFEDEVLMKDMLQCTDGHLFCRSCIRRHAEMHIGQGNYHFPCLDPYCERQFPPIVLQDVLPSNVFSNLVRKMQEEEIRRADIPDLESCPHCSFCAIIPDADLKIFRCLNPECLKVTCRLCKELNHLPLHCDEIEQKPEVQFRTYVEDQMTDALVRTCPKCKRPIIKELGCNRMTCTCGQIFCYVCRETIKDYKHFEKGRCPLFSNDDDMHRLEVQEGARKAKQDYRETHPEARALELRHDPAQTPFAAVQREQQQYALGAMPRLNEHGQIVFQEPQRIAANNNANRYIFPNQQPRAQAQLPFNLPWPFNFWRTAPRPPPVVPPPDPNGFGQPAPIPNVFGQPAPNPNFFGLPAPIPNRFVQPAPIPNVFAQPAPIPNRFVQPAPIANVFGQLAQISNFFGLPAPIPNVFVQPAPIPNVFGQPAPIPNVFVQPAPIPNVFVQPALIPNVFGQPAPIPNVFGQPAPAPDPLVQPAPRRGRRRARRY